MARKPILRPGRRTFREDAAGQMMMLSAVLLLIGFVALAGMMARVSQLGTQTTTESSANLIGQIGPVKKSLEDGILRLRAPVSQQGFGLTPITSPTLEQATIALLKHYEDVEASRGLLMDFQIACGGVITAQTVENSVVTVHLYDGTVWIQIPLSTTITRSTPCANSPVCTAGTLPWPSGCPIYG